MKNIILIQFIIFSNLFFAQINLNINKTNGTVSYSISNIDSSYIDLNNNLKKVVLLNGTVESHSLNDIINVTYSQPSYLVNSIFCDGIPTPVVDVINPITGKTWMDRNLGASQVASSSTNVLSFGDLYQWGRRADGHQCRNSATTTTLSSTNTPNHFPQGIFIIVSNSPWDWRSPQNTNLWQGLNGVNNPCPTGYRLPTETELNAERTSWSSNNAAGAFASPLKLPVAGLRSFFNGSLGDVGTDGGYWSSTVSGTDSRYLNFGSGYAFMNTSRRADGGSVRCLKD